jgi:protein TonB
MREHMKTSASLISAGMLLISMVAYGQSYSAPIKNARVMTETCPEPSYPREWLNAGEKGTVQLALLISASGKVLESNVVYSTGFPRLDNAAMEAFSQCRFNAGTVDGAPTEMWTVMKFTYRDGN